MLTIILLFELILCIVLILSYVLLYPGCCVASTLLLNAICSVKPIPITLLEFKVTVRSPWQDGRYTQRTGELPHSAYCIVLHNIQAVKLVRKKNRYKLRKLFTSYSFVKNKHEFSPDMRSQCVGLFLQKVHILQMR